MTLNRNLQTVLQWSVDPAGVAAVQAANTQILNSTKIIETETVSAAGTLKQATASEILDYRALADAAQNAQMASEAMTENTVAAFTKIDTSVKTVIRDIGDLGRDIEMIPEPDIGTLPGEGGGSGSGGASGILGSASRAAIALPGVGFQSPLVLGLRAAEKAADATGASLLQVGVAGGIVIGSLAVMKVAFDEFTKSIAEAKKTLDGALSAQTNYYHALATATSEQVREQLDGMKRIRDAQKLQIEELQQAIDSAFKQEQAQFGDVGARALQASGQSASAQLQKQLDDLNKQFQENDQSITRFTQGLEANAFAANDATAALEQRTKIDLDYAHLVLQADSLTAEQRKEAMAQDQRNIAVLQDLIDKGGLTADANAQLSAQISDLAEHYATLKDVTSSYGDQLQREEEEKKRITEATDNYFDAVTAENEAIQKGIELENKRREAIDDHVAKLHQIAQDENEKEIADREKAASQAEDDTAKHLQRIKEIEDQYATDHEADVGNRDALANYKDRQKRDKAEQKENDTYTLQEQQLAKHLQEQLEQDRKAQQKAEQAENESYSKRYRELVQALNEQHVAESRAEQLAYAYQAQANLHRQSLEVTHQNALLATAYQGGFLVEQAFARTMANLALIAGGSKDAGKIKGSAQSFDAAVRGIVNNQVATLVRSALS